MDNEGNRCTALLAEIDAFYQGFGHPTVLANALRTAVLFVPLTDDDRISTSEIEGIDWVCAFTSEQEYAKYVVARGENSGQHRYHTLLGWRIVDDLIPSLGRPTGVVVDICGTAPMAFPPTVDEVA
ncbi:MAG: hypothetical protein GX610_03835 [Rhodococcus sp.]|nr:hypothetical protein [Rhodococcus sp. (in: high G+C Gram-positive bacteria)]